jgi:hypothetical protein
MANETERLKPGPRTGAAGWGDQSPEPDVRKVVDRVMDDEHRTLRIEKEVTGRGQ